MIIRKKISQYGILTQKTIKKLLNNTVQQLFMKLSFTITQLTKPANWLYVISNLFKNANAFGNRWLRSFYLINFNDFTKGMYLEKSLYFSCIYINIHSSECRVRTCSRHKFNISCYWYYKSSTFESHYIPDA